MLGRTLYTSSCDAGARWTFTNVVGNPIRVWDSRDHVVRSVYDVLHRRTELRVQTGVAAEVLAEQTIYGETLATPATTNHRGRVYQVKDGAGVMTNVSYDFKGNLLLSQRQLAQGYITQLDWSQAVALESETFVQETQYDALNRPTSITTPDTSELKPIYNEAGLLEKVQARIRNAATWTTFVDDIDYDAKGQRERIVYGNGVITEYEYDEFTFRVKRIKTTRTSDNKILQDLRYTYDAVGNIVEMADLAYATFFHAGQEIKPVWQYEYDALYRLIYANGREHAGQQANIQQDENGFPLVNTPNPNDPSAMRMYTETYHYDAVGNILKMVHDAQSNTGDWTRFYHVAATSNRLLDTSLPGNNELDPVYSATYLHDAHGNMTKMPHVAQMDWDFKDQMQRVRIANNQDVYFTYDASGQRVRKVWVHQNIVEERIYLGGYEVYRKHQSNSIRLERQTLHVMDDTRRIAMVETKTIDTSGPSFTPTPRLRYQCSNHLGSAMLELDGAGLVISYEEYHPYGTSAYRAMKNNVDVSAKRYRYTGKERDEETGLYYHGARYYACWLARWTSADPAGMVDGVNLYQYVRGRPIGSIDPTGTEEKSAVFRRVDPEAVIMTKALKSGLAPGRAAWYAKLIPSLRKELSARDMSPTLLPLMLAHAFSEMAPGIPLRTRFNWWNLQLDQGHVNTLMQTNRIGASDQPKLEVHAVVERTLEGKRVVKATTMPISDTVAQSIRLYFGEFSRRAPKGWAPLVAAGAYENPEIVRGLFISVARNWGSEDKDVYEGKLKDAEKEVIADLRKMRSEEVTGDEMQLGANVLRVQNRLDELEMQKKYAIEKLTIWTTTPNRHFTGVEPEALRKQISGLDEQIQTSTAQLNKALTEFREGTK